MVVQAYLIDYLFIVSKSGLPYFIHDTRELEFSKESDNDTILISGVLTAIQHFLNNLTDTELKVIDAGFDKIIIHKRDEISVAAISKLEFVNNILELLIEIANDFVEQFSVEIERDLNSSGIYESFRGKLESYINIDRILTIYPNDIFRINPLSIVKYPKNYVIGEYGVVINDIISKFDGKQTLYHILNRINLSYDRVHLETNLKKLFKEGIIRKLPEGQKHLQIVSQLFRTFLKEFSNFLGEEKVITILKQILEESSNPLAEYLDVNEQALCIDFNEIMLGLTEDPTFALNPSFQKLINLLIDFIAKIQIEGKSKIKTINEAIENTTKKYVELYPQEVFVTKFSDLLEMMILDL